MKFKENYTRKLVLTALFIGIGLILPFMTMQIPSIGNMLSPMHFPVILCGFLCGGLYGGLAGFIVPLLRSILFGAPVLMPTALAMAFELATYGLVTGLLYQKLCDKRFGIYMTQISAMIAGRIVWGLATLVIWNMLGNQLTWQIFMAQAFFNAIPGIILQLILIPLLVYKLKGTYRVGASYDR